MHLVPKPFVTFDMIFPTKMCVCEVIPAGVNTKINILNEKSDDWQGLKTPQAFSFSIFFILLKKSFYYYVLFILKLFNRTKLASSFRWL